MIGKSNVGLRAVTSLQINNRAVNYESVVNLTMEVEESLHDYACIEMAGIPTRAISDYYGAPVHFTVSTGAKFVHDFYGTVERVDPVSKVWEGLLNGSPFQQAKLHCFGSSYRMRGKKSKVWENTSLTDLARTMAARYKFSLDVPQVPAVTPRLVQENESDWVFLNRIARSYGYRVNVHGTHMHVYSPLDYTTRVRSVHRLSTLYSAGTDIAPGRITEFRAKMGRGAKDGTHMESLVTVLQDDGTYYDVTSSEVLKTQGATISNRLSEAVDSYAEARTVLTAEATDQYDYIAEVSTMGSAGAFPGGVADVTKFRGDMDGLWYIRSVSHTVNTSGFNTSFVLNKNAGTPPSRIAVRPYSQPPIPRLINSSWETSKARVNVYA